LEIWDEYFKKIQEIGTNITEHSFRTPFENLLNTIKPQTIKVIHEQKREKGFGAPDFRIESSGATLGYIETKSLDSNLDKVLKSKQIDKYLSINPHLILTNYYEFIFVRKDKDKKAIDRCNLFISQTLTTKGRS
jgi:hypothetical protein